MKLLLACLVALIGLRTAAADPAETTTQSFEVGGGVFVADPAGVEIRFDYSHRLLEDLWLHFAYARGTTFSENESGRDRALVGMEQRGCDSSGVVCGIAGVGVGFLHIGKLGDTLTDHDVYGGVISVQAAVEVGMQRGFHLRLALEPHLVVARDSGLGCDLTLGVGLRL